MRRLQRKRNARVLLVAIVAIAITVMLFPLPTPGFLAARTITIAKSASARDKAIAIVGNSVVDHVSACDKDRRDLPAMLAEATGRPTIDLSYGGQNIAESLSIGALALRSPGVERLVVFVSLVGLADRDAIDLQSALFFRATGQDLAATDPVARLGRGVMVIPHTQARLDGFVYEGVSYPDYNGIKARYLTAERNAMKCPETLGRNLQFIEAYYWQAFAHYPVWEPNVADLVRLSAMAKEAGKPISIVLLPIDLPDMNRLNPTIAKVAAERRDRLLAALRQAGVEPIDATETVGAEGFADRYCACGHLNEQGRAALIAAMARTVSN